MEIDLRFSAIFSRVVQKMEELLTTLGDKITSFSASID
jgi:hypothetical protein